MKRKFDTTNQHDPVLDVFSGLYSQTLGEEPPSEQQMTTINEELTQKTLPKDILWYPIYADQPNTWQADLMFEPYTNSKKERIMVAILVVINVNTRYAFARPVDYYKNVKAMDEREWNDKSTRILLNNKDAPLVLRSFQRILQDMKDEASVLNEIKELKGKVQFKIDRLFTDEGSEFKSVFASFCESHDIRVSTFRPSQGSKRRMAIAERFNRTLRRVMEKTRKLKGLGNMELKNIIPQALDMYNRYLNNRSIESFFRRNLERGEKWRTTTGVEKRTRFFPAMMLLPGTEQEYIEYMKAKSLDVSTHYESKKKLLKPGALVRYFKRVDNPFIKKSKGSTMSEPVKIIGKHTYSYATDKSTRTGPIRKHMESESYSVEGTTQRFMPYELELVK
jgi:hypothetical protein